MNANLEETTKKELTMNIRKRNGEMEPLIQKRLHELFIKITLQMWRERL